MIQLYYKNNFFIMNFSEILKKYQIDGIITDIPYKNCIKNVCKEKEFDFQLFFQKIEEITPKNSFLISFCNMRCFLDLIKYSKNTKWEFHTYQIWNKEPTRNWISYSLPLRTCEFIIYFKSGNFKFDFRNGIIKKPIKRTSFGSQAKNTQKRTIKKYPTDKEIDFLNNLSKEKGIYKVEEKIKELGISITYGMYSEILTYKNQIKKKYFAEKPIEFSKMFKQIIGKNSLVLDPFAGTGNLVSNLKIIFVLILIQNGNQK